MEKVVVIVGPTGVGKTKTSIELAKQWNGEIISGDSMQIYKHMDIGTAKIKVSEMEGIPHYLLSVKEVDEPYSVFEYQSTVRSLITEITNRGKLPIIVGGTGLYIKSVLYDYTFQKEEKEVTSSIQSEYSSLTNEELHHKLQTIDPKSAEKIHPNNCKRVLRAIEYFQQNNHPISENIEQQEHKLIYDAFAIGLSLDRDALYQRINQRVDLMVQEGLVDEVHQLFQKGYSKDLQSIRAIGYKELYEYFEGTISLESAIDLIKQNSRRYAKRQYTFFNHQMDIHWYPVNLEDFSQTLQVITKDLKQFI